MNKNSDTYFQPLNAQKKNFVIKHYLKEEKENNWNFLISPYQRKINYQK